MGIFLFGSPGRKSGANFQGILISPNEIFPREEPNSHFVLGSLDPRRIFPTEDRNGARLGFGRVNPDDEE